jgi:ERCC4-related helicase
MGELNATKKREALETLTVGRLRELADGVGIEVDDRRSRDGFVGALADGRRVRFEDVLELLKRPELQQMCDALGFDRSGKEKGTLVARLLAAGAEPESASTNGEPRHAMAEPSKPQPRRASTEPLAFGPTLGDVPISGPPTIQSVLGLLPKIRLIELGRGVGLAVPPDATREVQVKMLAESGLLGFRSLMEVLGRDELRAACKVHGLDNSGRARTALAARLLEAHGTADTVPPRPIFKAHEIPRYIPRVGDIAVCRHRQWLVEDVAGPPEDGQLTLVRMVCLDDDNQGRPLEVLWDRELGARVIQPETHGLGTLEHIDPPRHFAAYLHALKWGSVTATDAQLFQAPFRAGIKLMSHQLTPLKKALALPRANLFIADDVGLGKTIEAGLVLQELLLRQQVEFALIVCPASVSLQWRDEMQKRFGLHFEIMNRAFIARRRQERGFGVNPWTTHNRFIVSYPILRRPEYRDPLLQHIGQKARKSMLILDEAHVAAPATASKYAIDSRITRVIRDVAPKFENRLFLSATPHNGHSNSFSALLEILDPQRFTRGVKVRGERQLDDVMVRRLKSDLRKHGDSEQFPKRLLVQVALRHTGDTWSLKETAWNAEDNTHKAGHETQIAGARPVELELSRLLAEYTAQMKPEKGRGKLVFINLQKRLLSSIEAFARTLSLHAASVEKGKAATQLDLRAAPSFQDDGEDAYGPDDDALEAEAALEVSRASRLLESPEAGARATLDTLVKLAEQHRGGADAKARALVDWIARNQCAAVRVGGADTKKDTKWTDTRVLIFTEYGDTKRYLVQLLSAAVGGTDNAEERILQLHGGMGDEQREEVQRAFNSPPGEHPVRILVATDAAREGVNLQGHCADLFHYDVPWNPARMEQRNGRIDRTLQPQPEVRCHYFLYPDRKEDLVLEKLVEKVATIQKELGSLSAVLMDHMEEVLRDGIDARTPARLDPADMGETMATASRELEKATRLEANLKKELKSCGELLENSRKVMEFDARLLRDAIDVGLDMAGAPPLEKEAEGVWRVPELPESWQPTLDSLRPPQRRDEPFWEWRKKAPQPVLFEPPDTMNSAQVHLHLEHPFVKRIMSRFRSQGFSAQDLSRVTIVRNRADALTRVIAFGRLSLFGEGATRLHDALVPVAARWLEDSDELRPFAEEADRRALERLEESLKESPTLDGVGSKVQQRVLGAAPALFAQLWKHIRDEADAMAKKAEEQLTRRGRIESEALTRILKSQQEAIDAELAERRQVPLGFGQWDKLQQDQYKQDEKHMHARRATLEKELEEEPVQIAAHYKVLLKRLEPVGLVVLWPTVRS